MYKQKGYVARRGRGETYRGLWLGILRERNRFGIPGLDGSIILRFLIRNNFLGGWGLEGECSRMCYMCTKHQETF
jgi:hypothetical protein